MSLDSELKVALQAQRKKPKQTFAAIITKVNDDDTVDVKDITDFPYTKVRLKASVKELANKLVIYPKVGSNVLVSMIGNDENTLVISNIDEAEKIKGIINQTEFEVDNEGYKINRKGENLKKVLNDFIDEVNKILVVNGTTINVAAVEEIKLRLNKILK
ncbi:hypothetical protein GGR32_000131 [Mesonia hippocampi]|uniref:Uncharacterized protein n=1 Tax=Mesonia hippocampi TaxID=1628250 RepID=A0A840EHF6_9FLAO|nr:hypothetical protein [Mesonia hippocampi]MBB4117859.1 hypothetical protein [Mesonia hippocampi]